MCALSVQFELPNALLYFLDLRVTLVLPKQTTQICACREQLTHVETGLGRLAQR